jgi:hypothetical protein
VKATACAILALGALGTGLMVDRAASGSPDALPFAAWALGPYAGYALLVFGAERPAAASLGAVAGTLFGTFAYYDGFFVHVGAQNALLFLFIPLWQWVGFGGVAAASALSARFSPRKE